MTGVQALLYSLSNCCTLVFGDKLLGIGAEFFLAVVEVLTVFSGSTTLPPAPAPAPCEELE